LLNDFGLRFGVYLPTYLPTGKVESLLKFNQDVVLTVEKTGLDSAWTCDHMCGIGQISEKMESRTPDILEPWTSLAYLASQTKKVIYGTCVACVPYRNPALLAKMAANMDHITEGKFILGVGAGWRKEEFEGYGLHWEPFSERYERTKEAIEIIKRMWAEPTVNYCGKYYQLKGGQLWPKPLQRPRPPIWLGAGGPKMTTLVKDADGYMPGLLTPQEYEERAHLVDALVDGRKIGMGFEYYTSIAEDADKAKEQCAEFVKQWFGQSLEDLGKGVQMEVFSKGKKSIPGFVVGGPDECISGIERYVKAGVRHFVMHFMPMTSTIGGLKIYAERVVPYFREMDP
jgi:alkanesulfonate monooxygenase SsuD/methylene tetrahydromethanopterin reductase-like flavin-dependent oxidoreductase (luciferase family)